MFPNGVSIPLAWCGASRFLTATAPNNGKLEMPAAKAVFPPSLGFAPPGGADNGFDLTKPLRKSTVGGKGCLVLIALWMSELPPAVATSSRVSKLPHSDRFRSRPHRRPFPCHPKPLPTLVVVPPLLSEPLSKPRHAPCRAKRRSRFRAWRPSTKANVRVEVYFGSSLS